MRWCDGAMVDFLIEFLTFEVDRSTPRPAAARRHLSGPSEAESGFLRSCSLEKAATTRKERRVQSFRLLKLEFQSRPHPRPRLAKGS